MDPPPPEVQLPPARGERVETMAATRLAAAAAGVAADPAGWSAAATAAAAAAAGFAPSAGGWFAAALAAPPPRSFLRLCTVGALGLHVRSKAVLSTFECR